MELESLLQSWKETARHLSLSWARWIQFMHTPPTNRNSWWPISICSLSCSKILKISDDGISHLVPFTVWISSIVPHLAYKLKQHFEIPELSKQLGFEKFRTRSFGLKWVGLLLSLLSEDRSRFCSRNTFNLYFKQGNVAKSPQWMIPKYIPFFYNI